MGNNLKKYRLEAGLTQKQVAQMLELDCENRLCRWEKGQAMPSVINLYKLARIYGVVPTNLYLLETKTKEILMQ